MNQLALEGQVDNRDEVIDQLRAENRRLAEDLRQAKLEIVKAKSDNEAVLVGVQEIRNLLTPLYRGLRLTFGEMDAMPIANNGSSQSTSTPSTNNPKLAIWQKWIQKFGDSYKGKMISTLLEHGPMTTEQLRIPLQCSGQTVINTYNNLRQHGLITKSNGRYSLKEI
jgi:hypothetical protein